MSVDRNPRGAGRKPKLTPDQVRELERLRELRTPWKELQARFGVCRATLSGRLRSEKMSRN